MKNISNHLYKNILTGIVTILPIALIIIAISYTESSISNSGINKLFFYFPGLGLILAALALYLLGLATRTMFGKFFWKKLDTFVQNIPAVGSFYNTIKQILGYGQAKDSIFLYAALINAEKKGIQEIGFVTNTIKLPSGENNVVVFVPGAPNPSNGKLVIVPEEKIQKLNADVNEAFKSLVSIGKTNIKI